MRGAIVAAAFIGALAVSASGQTLLVGSPVGGPFHRESLHAAGFQTTVQLRPAVNLEGDATTATFGWSATPCPAAVKIKFFRPQGRLIPFGPTLLNFVDERGPFDVTAPLDPSAAGTVSQSVALNPPVHLRRGDLVAITNLTSCGGPVSSGDPSETFPPPPPSSATVPGDETRFVAIESATLGRAAFVTATGPSPYLGLLANRFAVSMTARNPRNRATASGVPVRLGEAAGYFALPELTRDATFPEVIVKMTDATGVPTLGGTFWFFHSPLTDVDYVLTVTDQQKEGATRTYLNSRAPSGELCGAADTSAFPP